MRVSHCGPQDWPLISYSSFTIRPVWTTKCERTAHKFFLFHFLFHGQAQPMAAAYAVTSSQA